MDLIVAAVPFVLLIAVAMWGARMKRVCPIKNPPQRLWPMAENPGLALELADSPGMVDAVLGPADSELGQANRRSAIRFQHLDYVLIPLYTLFFAITALVVGTGMRAIAAVVLALVTALFDFVEDKAIIGMAEGQAGSSAKRFGRLKWLFYFGTLAAEGILLLPLTTEPTARHVGAGLLGAMLILTGFGGAISALKTSFNGILSASTLSFFVLVPLSLTPLISLATFSWREAIAYCALMRVPILLALILLALPFVAFFSGAKSLLRGLFDLTPAGLFVVTLTAVAAARAACVTASLVLAHAAERFGVGAVPPGMQPGEVTRLVATVIVAAPLVLFAIGFSVRQKRGTVPLIISAMAGVGLAIGASIFLDRQGAELAERLLGMGSERFAKAIASTGLFQGYLLLETGNPPAVYEDHLAATAAFLTVIALYTVLGFYGYTKIGKARTIPALTSALMLLMMVSWLLAGATFFFDRWRVPVLLVVLIAGTLTAQSSKSDDLYKLRRRKTRTPAPDPAATITASGTERIVVVAANGGGIQAGAWAAQVLQGLYEDSEERFRKALRMISSVSGGSMGTAFFVHWLATPANSRIPAEAASESSLDEVAWGLGWTDFLRALLPWVFGRLIGRGRALERAWCLNSAPAGSHIGELDQPLSNWNDRVATGEIPGVVMNATVAETGERLLLGTTTLRATNVRGPARVDAADLHRINGEPLDVGIVTAARLSASFPYVTPAARSDGPGPQPHVVDGGYYDNYGMATLVEWLDEALTGAKQQVKSVLVIQVLGAPVDRDPSDNRHGKSRGWFYQAFAPLTTLAAVRSAGQLAHNDIELGLTQQKWLAAGIPVHTVTFEFSNADAPLSWHLTAEEIDHIQRGWEHNMGPCRQLVKRFLAGSDDLDCGCPGCTSTRVSAGATA